MTIPSATAVNLEPNRTYPGAYVVTVKCPYCPASHRHGITELTTDGGHRTADCIDRHMHTPTIADISYTFLNRSYRGNHDHHRHYY